MTTHGLQSFDLNLPVSSVETYISYVNQIPLLTQIEESELASRLYFGNDLEAARRLVLAHLRYVVRVAKGYLGYGLPLNDLIQEGNIGLMKAVKRFNPKVGVRLVTFAMHWIKAEIHEFVLRNWRIVKIATTKAQRKLFFNLRSMKKHSNGLTQEEVTSIAKDLRVKPETVREMEMRLTAMDTSFEIHEEENDNLNHIAPAAYLEDSRYNPEQQLEISDLSEQTNSALRLGLDALDKRSQEILNARWLNEEKSTLQELADKYQVSAERIRQLEKTAMKKLRLTIENTTTT